MMDARIAIGRRAVRCDGCRLWFAPFGANDWVDFHAPILSVWRSRHGRALIIQMIGSLAEMIGSTPNTFIVTYADEAWHRR